MSRREVEVVCAQCGETFAVDPGREPGRYQVECPECDGHAWLPVECFPVLTADPALEPGG